MVSLKKKGMLLRHSEKLVPGSGDEGDENVKNYCLKDKI